MEQKYKKWLWIAGVLLVLFIIYSAVTGSYNSLIQQRVAAQTQEAQIETQMQRRADLIPNVVSATKGGMSQEKAVFASISKAYSLYQNAPTGSVDKLNAGGSFSGGGASGSW